MITVNIMRDDHKFKYEHSFEWFQDIRYNRDLTRYGKWFFNSLTFIFHAVVMPTTVLWYVFIKKIPSILYRQDANE